MADKNGSIYGTRLMFVLTLLYRGYRDAGITTGAIQIVESHVNESHEHCCSCIRTTKY